MRRGPRTALAALAVATVAAGVGGCGLGAGGGASNVSLTVTRGFGAAQLGSVTEGKVPGSETVMRMLERSFRVRTRYGGGFVESIAGHSGTSSHLDWFYYVNGVEAPQGAATTAVHHGDRIWWDLHDWSATYSIPAVVGSFPEPFVHGVGGRRLPTVLECESSAGVACKRVQATLSATGVAVATQAFGVGSGNQTVTVLVGTWSALHGTLVSQLVQAGPSASGVYARFSAGGRALALLDSKGHAVRTLGAGAGLVAATDDQNAGPTWLITGTDARGVAAAAAALQPGTLRDHFALAVEGSTTLPVPVQGAP